MLKNTVLVILWFKIRIFPCQLKEEKDLYKGLLV